MSFMRLLSAGRSLMGGDDRTNRYRLPRRRLMPKFGGDANPFASTVRPTGGRENAALSPTAPPDPPHAQAVAEADRPASDCRWPMADGQLEAGTPQPVPAASALPTEPTAAVPPISGARRRWSWRAWLNFFRRRPSGSPFRAASSLAPTAQPSIRQGELSLANVRVVSNDFSDTEEEPPPRPKGRHLLGRSFPRAAPEAGRSWTDDELPVEPASRRPVEAEAGQTKLF